MVRLATRLATTALTVMLLAAPVRAQDYDLLSGLHFGVYGGANSVWGSWRLHEDSQAGLSPSDSAIVGLRVGWQFLEWLGVELGIATLPYETQGDGSGLAMSYSADLLVFPLEGSWTPFVGVGGGLYHNVSGAYGDDLDYHIHWELGARGSLLDWLSLRLEARHLMTDAFEKPPAHNLEVTLSIEFFPWRSSPPPEPTPDPVKPTDIDGDGILDSVDACPRTPGHDTADGCPDGDMDGVADRDDNCPDDPGAPRMGGCPDTDGDGFEDPKDDCPEQPGVRAHRGCPPPKDADADGVPDDADRCPQEPGTASAHGCIPDALAELAELARKLRFEDGSATIPRRARKVLAKIAALLTAVPDVRLRVEGHTDDGGDAAALTDLSRQQAEAVREALITGGVDAKRLEAVGLGGARPRFDNRTEKGRLRNRRIEFRLLP